MVHADVLKSGFIPNEEKSIWDPAQNIIWPGTVINTSECLMSATDSRIQSLTEDFVVFLTAANHNVRNAHAVLMKRSYSVVGFRLTG